jgi:predicted peptidase
MISPSPQPASTTRLRALTTRSGYDCLVSLPEDYGLDPARRWPLIFFLHGSAFRGDDVHAIATHGLLRLLNGGELSAADEQAAAMVAANFVVLAPQCPTFEVWEDATLLAVLEEVTPDYALDLERVHLTGLSMGGFGAWSLGMRHARRFATLVPVCGGGRVADVTAAMHADRTALEELGVWAFHGMKDTVVPAEESQRMIDVLRAAGVRDARLTLYPEANHDSWTATYANLELYAWMLGHER